MRVLLAVLAIPLLVGIAPSAQEADQESELDRLLRAARTGRTVIRPQAAHRIVRFWQDSDSAQRTAITARLLAESGETTASLAQLGSALIEMLGAFADTQLRDRLWAAVDDADFPWRPYAARGLASSAVSAESERFAKMLLDTIAPVRAAGVEAYRVLDLRDHSQFLRLRLSDTDDRVRRTAADLLAHWGQADALYWLLEELGRQDTFFDRPTGLQARYQSLVLIERHLGDAAGYDADLPPQAQANLTALRVLEQRVAEHAAGERPELPEVARAGVPTPRSRFGLELRSCRLGEHYLRWTADDVLLVGQGRPARVQLPPGTVARLSQSGAAHLSELQDRRFFGAPGCDMEHFLWRAEVGGDTSVWIVSKGPEAVENLRPKALGRFYAELLATLPDEPSSLPRTDRLRSRVRATLAALGGPIE